MTIETLRFNIEKVLNYNWADEEHDYQVNPQASHIYLTLSLFFATYNFCKKHTTLRMTPAMAAGITDRPWTLTDLLEAA